MYYSFLISFWDLKARHTNLSKLTPRKEYILNSKFDVILSCAYAI